MRCVTTLVLVCGQPPASRYCDPESGNCEARITGNRPGWPVSLHIYDKCPLDPRLYCTTIRFSCASDDHGMEEMNMAWTKPTLKEIACGMEINMYAPAEDEPVLF